MPRSSIVAAINALDLSAFPAIFTESYIQHSGRSASGLPAQIENAQRLHATWPDIHMQVEDRIIDADKVVARCLYAGTHSQTVRGFAPTGRKITFATIDIWRVEGGKFAEHWDLVDVAGMEKQLAGK
jgi:predicted ester cyclase